jgi:hypothetical protein
VQVPHYGSGSCRHSCGHIFNLSICDHQGTGQQYVAV